MHILMVNTRHYHGGGDSNYTFSLADLLRANGHEVSFFAMQGPNNLPDPNSDLFVSHIDYRELNRRKNPITAAQVMTRSIYSKEARQKFARMVERVKPDVVHLQNIHAHLTPSIIFEAKQRGLPIVWTLHDYKLVCPNSHFLIDQTGEICEACRGGQFWQAACKRCKKGSLLASGMASLEAYAHQMMNVRGMVDAFLCPSSFLRTKLLENGFDALKTRHIPLFLPHDAFAYTPEDEGYLLFLGKLEPLKGIFPLLEAARRVQHVKVILAGRVDESLQSELSALLPSNVTYVGFKSGQELAELRHGARALVLPSLWYENQPLSILEAFALGKPVIASNLGGMRELVGENERGLLVAAGDVDDLARALQLMADNPAKARQLGVKALAYATEIYSPENHYKLISKIYQNIAVFLN